MAQDNPLNNNSSNQGQNQNRQNSNSSGGNSDVIARVKASPLSVTIFENENGYRNFELQRTYTQDDGDSFQYTNSLRPQDLRKAARLLEEAADLQEDISVDTVQQD